MFSGVLSEPGTSRLTASCLLMVFILSGCAGMQGPGVQRNEADERPRTTVGNRTGLSHTSRSPSTNKQNNSSHSDATSNPQSGPSKITTKTTRDQAAKRQPLPKKGSREQKTKQQVDLQGTSQNSEATPSESSRTNKTESSAQTITAQSTKQLNSAPSKQSRKPKTSQGTDIPTSSPKAKEGDNARTLSETTRQRQNNSTPSNENTAGPVDQPPTTQPASSKVSSSRPNTNPSRREASATAERATAHHHRRITVGFLFGVLTILVLFGGLTLVRREPEEDKQYYGYSEPAPEEGGEVRKIPLDKIAGNPHQPRSRIDEDKLEQLATSIENYGVLSPIQVTRTDSGTYQLIDGERRVRACQQLDRETIPALIRDLESEAIREIGFLENLHHKRLDPVDEAKMYQRLRNEFKNLSLEELGDLIGKPPDKIKKREWILQLSPLLQKALTQNILDLETAQALKDRPIDDQRAFLRFIKENDPGEDQICQRLKETQPTDTNSAQRPNSEDPANPGPFRMEDARSP